MIQKEYKILEQMTEEEQNTLENTIFEAHEKEAKKRGLEFYNFGWSQTENGICSKTSAGFLTTEMNLVTKKIRHSFKKC